MKPILTSLTIAASSMLAASASADAIDTFRQICVANAGNVAAIVDAGNRAGFSLSPFSGNSHMGVRTSTDESLQINVATSHSFECAVTTSDMQNPQAVNQRFFKSLGLTPRGGTARGVLNGKTYTFLHDTKGGEAFVIYAD